MAPATRRLADRHLAEQHREHVRLGAFPTALASFVPAAIARLRDAHGDVQFQLSELTAANLESRLLAGEFDVALGYQDATSERREIPGAERIDLFQETFLVGLRADHRLAGSTTPISLAKFAKDDWIVPSTEGFLIQACRDAGFDPRIVAVTSDPLATRGLITRGLGVGWVASLLIHDYADAVIRPVKDPIRRRDIYALLPPGDRHPLAKTPHQRTNRHGRTGLAVRIATDGLTDADGRPGREVSYRDAGEAGVGHSPHLPLPRQATQAVQPGISSITQASKRQNSSVDGAIERSAVGATHQSCHVGVFPHMSAKQGAQRGRCGAGRVHLPL